MDFYGYCSEWKRAVLDYPVLGVKRGESPK